MPDNENDNKFHDNKSAWNTPVTDLVDDDSSTFSTVTDTSDVADLGNFDDVPKGVTNKLRRISQDNPFLGLINGNAQRNGGNNVHEQQNNVDFWSMHSNDSNLQEGFSPIWGDNNGTVGPEAGFTNNFSDDFIITTSDKPFGNAVKNNRNVNALRNFPPVIADPTRLANLDNESRPYRSSYLNDEGYNSDPDFGNNLDNGSKAGDKPGRLAQIRQEGAKLFGIAGKSFSKLSARDQVLVGAAIGALVTIALPALLFAIAVIAAGGIIAAAGALIGAVVGAVLYAGVKTVQGINWTAQKTIEGAKSTARNITSGISHTVANVGAKIQYSATETDYQEKLRRLTDAQNESYDEVKDKFQEQVSGDESLSRKNIKVITQAVLKTIVSMLDSEITAMEKEKLAAKGAGDEKKVAEAAETLDLLKQQKELFDGLKRKPGEAYNLFSGQQTVISNKDRYLFTIAVAGNSNAIIDVIGAEVQKAYDEKSKLANNASRAQDKSKLLGLFTRKPKAVAQVASDDSGVESGPESESRASLASENPPVSGNDKGARVHFADVLNQGETIPIVSSRRVTGYGTVSSSNSIFGSDNTLNNGSGDSGINSPVAGSPVHGDNSLKPRLGDGISQTRLRSTGNLHRLVSVGVEQHVGNGVTVN